MNATKTAVNRAFAIFAVMALVLCSFAAVFATEESEAAPDSSLQQSGTDVGKGAAGDDRHRRHGLKPDKPFADIVRQMCVFVSRER